MTDRSIKNIIRTEATVLDGPLPETVMVAGFTVADFEAGGRAAGEKVGLSYKANYGQGSNADVSKFPAMLRGSLELAIEKMRSASEAEDKEVKISAWRESFMSAARAHIPDIDDMFDRFENVGGVTQITLAKL